MNIQWIELLASDSGILQRDPLSVELPEGATVLQALISLGWSEDSARQALAQRAVAVFGQYALADTVLYEADRVEILDKLQFNPMESRRRRAAHKEAEGAKRGRRSGKGGSTLG